jgi:UDP-N-acetylglucosamine 1-carboxyvinyltransferase
MAKIIVEGGAPLNGEVQISGAKNAVLPILSAGLLADGPMQHRQRAAPARRDHDHGTARPDGRGTGRRRAMHIGMWIPARPTSFFAPYELVKTMRASILVLGPLVARFGQAEVSLPAAAPSVRARWTCTSRACEALGAEITVENGYIKAKAKRLKRRAHRASTWSPSPAPRTS